MLTEKFAQSLELHFGDHGRELTATMAAQLKRCA